MNALPTSAPQASARAPYPRRTPQGGHAPQGGPALRATHATSLREAQVRLSQLVGLAELTDQVTMIERDGRPVAAIVPAAAARTAADTRQAEDRSAAVAAGWNRRLVDMHERMTERHRAELATLTGALRTAWAELDRLRPPGTDRHLDELRASHRQLVGAMATGTRDVPGSPA